VVVGLLVLTACGGGNAKTASSPGATTTSPSENSGVSTGVTDTEIKLSGTGSFSGPYAALYQQQYKAVQLTWRDAVNANGGINGRKIVLEQVDDRFTPEGAVAACKAVQSNGSFAAIAPSLFDSGLACLDEAHIPVIQNTMNSDPATTGWKNVRSINLAGTVGRVLAQYIVGPSGLNRAGHKVGVIYVGNQESTNATADTFITTAKSLGLQVHAEKTVLSQPSFTSELQRIKDSGADTVAIIAVADAIGIKRDAAAIHFTPTWTGTWFDADEVAAAGADAFKGIKAIRAYPPADSPAFLDYKALVAKYGETSVPPTTTLGATYGGVLVMQKALELAGRNLTRESFLAAFDQIKTMDTGLTPVVTFGPNRFVGADAYFPLECCNADKTWKGLGPARSTF
jgi:branched-chain amino acid transport system substrate-binding protein